MAQQQRSRSDRARRTARAVWPLVLAAWRRWDSLSPKEKERYRRMASEYAQRGRTAVEKRRRKK
jgi:TRAP-type C4-dicarboxylate transport system substrate-binding protein